MARAAKARKTAVKMGGEGGAVRSCKNSGNVVVDLQAGKMVPRR